MRKINSKEIVSFPDGITEEQIDEIREQLNLMVSSMWYSYIFNNQRQYQEPERDEHGVFYAYKILVCHNRELFSPLRYSKWSRNGFLESDREPHENNLNGIYFCKREYDEELFHVSVCAYNKLLVKCSLSGTVIEGETGFRSQYAQIVAVKVHREWIQYGHWKDYQDSQERSSDYPDRIAKKEKWEYPSRTGNWNSSTNMASEEDGEGS